MIELLGLLAIPVIVASLAWIVARDTITRAEFFAQLLISTALLIAAWSWARAKTLEDVEHLNDRVTKVERGRQDCCHCHSECQERYFFGLCKRKVKRCGHPHDYYWRVVVGEAGTLEETCKRRDTVPEWFDTVHEGDPGVIEHPYTNYFRADPDSLMHRGFGESNDASRREALLLEYAIPAYPAVHDGVRVDRVVTVGAVEAPPAWQRQLDVLAAELGPKKQVDLTVVLGDAESPELAVAVDTAWLSGPKNAVIVVLGAPDHTTVAWAQVVSLSHNPELGIALRERLRGRSLADPELIEIIGAEVEAKFERVPMETYSYLAGAAAPRGWWLVGLYILALLLSLGLSWVFHRLDFSREGVARAAGKHRRKGMWMVIAAAVVAVLRRRSHRY